MSKSSSPPTLPPLPPAIGLDCGTVYLSVAVFQNGEVKLIKDHEWGIAFIPSYVGFGSDPDSSVIMIGKEARDLAHMAPENTVFGFKRLIGLKEEAARQAGSEMEGLHATLNIVGNKNGDAAIKVHYKGMPKTYSPTELTAMLVQKGVHNTMTQLGVPVRDVVVTVPSAFNFFQREKVRHLHKASGLTVLQLIDEATAAAILHCIKNPTAQQKLMFVINLGAGFLSVSVVTVKNSQFFKVKSIAGDSRVGGNDFNNCLMNHVVKTFESKHKISLSKDQSAILRIRSACSSAKRALSTEQQTKVSIPCLKDGIDFEMTITRKMFEELNHDLFERILKPMESALSRACVSKSQIDSIVFAGGSAHIPKIQALIEHFFDGAKPEVCANPSQAPAFGAAILAAALQGNEPVGINLKPVIPFPIGVEIADGSMATLIDYGSRLPTQGITTFTTASRDQTNMEINVYEGEEEMAKDNLFLGKLTLSNLTQTQDSHAPKVKVTISVDSNGKYEMRAEEVGSGQNLSLVLSLETMKHKPSNGADFKPVLTESDLATKGSTGKRRSAFSLRKKPNHLKVHNDPLPLPSPLNIDSEIPSYATVQGLHRATLSHSPSPAVSPQEDNVYVSLSSLNQAVMAVRKLRLSKSTSDIHSCTTCTQPVQEKDYYVQFSEDSDHQPLINSKSLRLTTVKWNGEECAVYGDQNDVGGQKDTRVKSLLEEAIVEANKNVRLAEVRAKDAEDKAMTWEKEAMTMKQKVKESESRLEYITQMFQGVEHRLKVTQQEVAEKNRRMTLAEERFYSAARMLKEAEIMVNEERERTRLAEDSQRDAEQRASAAERRVREVENIVHQQTSWVIQKEEIEFTSREIGRGAWGVVKVVKFRGLKCAAKCMHSLIVSDYNRHLFVREMNMAAMLRHPNLVQFIGATMEAEREPVILTELMSSSLRSTLEKMPLNPSQIMSVSVDVALALNYLHLMQPDPILHRDVSSANVLLNRGPYNTYIAKLSDFGSANFVRRVTTVAPGNLVYAAPEVGDPSKQTTKMDVYSYGVLLLEVCTRIFPDPDTIDCGQLIRKVETSMPRMGTLISDCLQVELQIRPTMSEIVDKLVYAVSL